MKKTIYAFLTLLFVTYLSFGQQEIGKKIYLYGAIENSITGSTLIQYSENDKRTNGSHLNKELENKMVDLFKKKGIKAISYNDFFCPSSGNCLTTKSYFDKLLSKNNIKTIIKITLNNWPPNIISNSNSTINRKIDSTKKHTTTERIGGKVRLLIEIYSKNDEFNEPFTVISANTNKNWVLAKSHRNLAFKKLKKVLKSINIENN